MAARLLSEAAAAPRPMPETEKPNFRLDPMAVVMTAVTIDSKYIQYATGEEIPVYKGDHREPKYRISRRPNSQPIPPNSPKFPK